MRKFPYYFLVILVLVFAFSGCSSDKGTFENHVFVKPEKYVAVVNVSINPSFDIYLDQATIILAIEPKNEEAKSIDFSNYMGKELTTVIDDLISAICKNASINRESVALVKFIEGDENILDVNVVEIINDACADVVAKSTVNESMESVLQVRLETEYGCQCLECNNWYERHWYCYNESRLKCPLEVYEKYMDDWKKNIDEMNKSDPLYGLALESHENMTYEKFDIKEVKRQEFYINFEGIYGNTPHKEANVTYKILETVSNADGTHEQKTEEFTAEEYFEQNPDKRESMYGLEKVIRVQVKVSINGVEQDDYYSGVLYLCDGKWYSNNGIRYSPLG